MATTMDEVLALAQRVREEEQHLATQKAEAARLASQLASFDQKDMERERLAALESAARSVATWRYEPSEVAQLADRGVERRADGSFVARAADGRFLSLEQHLSEFASAKPHLVSGHVQHADGGLLPPTIRERVELAKRLGEDGYAKLCAEHSRRERERKQRR